MIPTQIWVMPTPMARSRRIDVFDGNDPRALRRMADSIDNALRHTSRRIDENEDEDEVDEDDDTPASEVVGIPAIPPSTDLIGIPEEVYRQINNALQSGHRHLLFYGPPGTGKTTLAMYVAGFLPGPQFKMVTGSADWSSQDIIGGYQPLTGGRLRFFPGVLIQNFDRPFIFDELNRCDIDKVIGPLFTVLSGQSTTLPYLTDPEDENSPRVEISPVGQHEPPRRYAVGPYWRLFATINSIDKASLYQMSYALTRRFAWIYVDVPTDLAGFLHDYFEIPPDPAGDVVLQLARMWRAISDVRAIGPAPILDIIRMIRAHNEDFDFTVRLGGDDAFPYLDGYYTFLLPMLDGIHQSDAKTLADTLIDIFGLGEGIMARSLRKRTEDMAI
jgi:5-methylcytosine-specific restriction enzyme B